MGHSRVQARAKRRLRRAAARDAKLTRALRRHWNYRNYDAGNSIRKKKVSPKIIRNLRTRPQKRGRQPCPISLPRAPTCLGPALGIYCFVYVTPLHPDRPISAVTTCMQPCFICIQSLHLAWPRKC